MISREKFSRLIPTLSKIIEHGCHRRIYLMMILFALGKKPNFQIFRKLYTTHLSVENSIFLDLFFKFNFGF